MSVYIPVLVSEREPRPPWTDCTWCSGVMLANGAAGTTWYPPTRAEYEALRAASGDLIGGSTITDLTRGMLTRYGWAGRVVDTWTQICTVPIGTVLAIQGSMGAIGAHYRRWDSSFTGAHCAAVVRTGQDSWWWLDPLAPAGYPGEPIPLLTLRAYFTGLAGAEAMTAPTSSRPGFVRTRGLTAIIRTAPTTRSRAAGRLLLGQRRRWRATVAGERVGGTGDWFQVPQGYISASVARRTTT